MTRSIKYQSVKLDLFKGYDEQEIIKEQKVEGKDAENPLFSKPLSSLFGFYEAGYYLKEIEDGEDKIAEFHLTSDKPFSKDEIKILSSRILVIYNEKYDRFKIFQEPESDLDADKWLKKRKIFETTVSDDDMSDPIYRTIGEIADFLTDKSVHHYSAQKDSGKKQKRKLSSAEYKNIGFHKLLKLAMQGQRFAEFWVDSVDATEDKVNGGKQVTIYINSKDSRITDFFADRNATTKMMQQYASGISSVEVVNMRALED